MCAISNPDCREQTDNMFRMWCKCFDDEGRLLKDTVIQNSKTDMSRTQKIFDALDNACLEFNLSKPIWLDANIETFKRHSKVRFNQDNFIDSIDFSFFEIEVIEED